ncbi:MAG: transcriptional regulator, partial [Methanomicrobiales archaeon HGW-Methanomicrobiales-4]
MNKMPCELVVWESLPAIRAAIASEMVDSGLSQRVVADILGMAPSAVSQYLSGKRGYRIEFNQAVRESIISLSNDLREGKIVDPGPRICSICTQIRGVPSCDACEES